MLHKTHNRLQADCRESTVAENLEFHILSTRFTELTGLDADSYMDKCMSLQERDDYLAATKKLQEVVDLCSRFAELTGLDSALYLNDSLSLQERKDYVVVTKTLKEAVNLCEQTEEAKLAAFEALGIGDSQTISFAPMPYDNVFRICLFYLSSVRILQEEKNKQNDDKMIDRQKIGIQSIQEFSDFCTLKKPEIFEIFDSLGVSSKEKIFFEFLSGNLYLATGIRVGTNVSVNQQFENMLQTRLSSLEKSCRVYTDMLKTDDIKLCTKNIPAIIFSKANPVVSFFDGDGAPSGLLSTGGLAHYKKAFENHLGLEMIDFIVLSCLSKANSKINGAFGSTKTKLAATALKRYERLKAAESGAHNPKKKSGAQFKHEKTKPVPKPILQKQESIVPTKSPDQLLKEKKQSLQTQIDTLQTENNDLRSDIADLQTQFASESKENSENPGILTLFRIEALAKKLNYKAHHGEISASVPYKTNKIFTASVEALYKKPELAQDFIKGSLNPDKELQTLAQKLADLKNERRDLDHAQAFWTVNLNHERYVNGYIVEETKNIEMALGNEG